MESRQRKLSNGSAQLYNDKSTGVNAHPAIKPGYGPIEGTIKYSRDRDKSIVFELSSQVQKPIRADIIEKFKLYDYIGSTTTATFENWQVIDFPLRIVRRDNTPAVVPAAEISEEAVRHSFTRHTLEGIYRSGKIESATKGDDIALFGLAATYRDIQYEIAEAHKQKLKWEYRDSSQCTAVFKKLKLIGTQVEDKVHIETVFPTDYNLPREFLESCLDGIAQEDLRTFNEFLAYVKWRIKQEWG